MKELIKYGFPIKGNGLTDDPLLVASQSDDYHEIFRYLLEGGLGLDPLRESFQSIFELATAFVGTVSAPLNLKYLLDNYRGEIDVENWNAALLRARRFPESLVLLLEAHEYDKKEIGQVKREITRSLDTTKPKDRAKLEESRVILEEY